ncbi:DUF2868 domain-containing protein [Hydrogenophaga sp. BPS33]|uniref:DUF2868 domain-containing protein n=1 Tax=Hydrogenophaga sp. BPS33 TaxID=2651974 RepID=UPI00131F678B|nr:DUF2868 domain-containing protein [Hydrogenophaga sp. BPS33]QHE85723.1 DUF2868 domain-containing protein [Hydrogenophaga sp. BPS33]
MPASPSAPTFRDLTLAHTLRLLEEAGALDDASEMALAHARSRDEQGRLLERARLLARRLGLLDDWARLTTGLWIAAGLLVVLAWLLAGGLLTRVLGSGQTVNAAFAFLAMLGMPLLALLVWLLWAVGSWLFGQGSAPWSLGQTLLALAARMPGLHGPHSLALLRGAHAALRQQRLSLWVFGAISHGLWALAFVLALLTLLVLFSFQAYQLTWETTILSPAFFDGFLRITSWLPRALGVVVPQAAVVHAAPSAADSQAIAWWLLACGLLYGLVPRLIALVVCAAVWARRARHLGLDTRDPYFRQLATRFASMAKASVVDAEHAPPSDHAPLFHPRTPGQTPPTVLIGFELPDNLPWPPQALAERADHVHTIRGSMGERLGLLTALAAAPGMRALVVCSAAASPDRGTARFLRQVCAEAVDCALLPLGIETVGTMDNKPQRWAHWLADSDLQAVAFCASPGDARQWMEQHRG